MSTLVRNLELEAAAFANFADIDSWRVYADWLLIVGDAHGEIVNLELARRDTYRTARGKFDASLDAKRREFAEAWREWASSRGLDGVTAKFKRGFVIDLTGALSARAAAPPVAARRRDQLRRVRPADRRDLAQAHSPRARCRRLLVGPRGLQSPARALGRQARIGLSVGPTCHRKCVQSPETLARSAASATCRAFTGPKS